MERVRFFSWSTCELLGISSHLDFLPLPVKENKLMFSATQFVQMCEDEHRNHVCTGTRSTILGVKWKSD